MKNRTWIYLLLLSACSPQVVSKTDKAMPATEPYQPFVIFALADSIQYTPEEVLGDITIKDHGLTINCEYETVVAEAAREAKSMGANALKVYEHKTPGLSSCHRIKAKALFLSNITDYEKKIAWHPQRKLQISDFKGSTVNRPANAATYSHFKYVWSGSPLKGKIILEVQTLFDCQQSYFKPDLDSVTILLHEQIHFDITELLARKFLETLEKEVHSLKELEEKQTRLFDQATKDLIKMQDQYDYETYNYIRNEDAWQRFIEKELEGLARFKEKILIIPYRNKT